MTWNKCEELRPVQKVPERLNRSDIKMVIAFGFCLVAASFVVGVFDGLDKAMAAQEHHNRLSVYCQQRESLATLCKELQD